MVLEVQRLHWGFVVLHFPPNVWMEISWKLVEFYSPNNTKEKALLIPHVTDNIKITIFQLLVIIWF